MLQGAALSKDDSWTAATHTRILNAMVSTSEAGQHLEQHRHQVCSQVQQIQVPIVLTLLYRLYKSPIVLTPDGKTLLHLWASPGIGEYQEPRLIETRRKRIWFDHVTWNDRLSKYHGMRLTQKQIEKKLVWVRVENGLVKPYHAWVTAVSVLCALKMRSRDRHRKIWAD